MLANFIVYRLTNLVNGKVYIGSTSKGIERIYDHFNSLRNGNHSNEHLQNSWNFYGCENFVGEIIEECTQENLIEREQWWMDYYKSYFPEFGYNIKKAAIGGMSAPIHSKIMKDYWSTVSPEKKAIQTSGLQSPKWEDPEYREFMLPITLSNLEKNNAKRKIDPEFDELLKSGLRKHNSREDISEINSEKKRKAWENPQYQEKHSSMMKELWNRPGFRENHAKKVSETARIKREKANKDIV